MYIFSLVFIAFQLSLFPRDSKEKWKERNFLRIFFLLPSANTLTATGEKWNMLRRMEKKNIHISRHFSSLERDRREFRIFLKAPFSLYFDFVYIRTHSVVKLGEKKSNGNKPRLCMFMKIWAASEKLEWMASQGKVALD